MLNGDLWTKNEKALSELFFELVPPSGKAESKAGEIVRATNRIIYRFFNDGDHIGIGYGRETCNAAARFLLTEAGVKVADFVGHLWGLPYEDEYERYLDYLGDAVIELIHDHPELREQPTRDMYDYDDPEEDYDDEDFDEYEYYNGEDDDENSDF